MRFVTRTVLRFARDHPWLTLGNMAQTLLFPIDDVLVPVLSGRLVELVQGAGAAAGAWGWRHYLVALIAVMIAMQVVYMLGTLHDAYFLPRLQTYVRDGMLRDVLTHYRDAPSASDLRTGEIMSRLVKIPMAVTLSYERFKNYLLPYTLSFLLTSGYVIWQDRAIGLTLLTCGLLAVCFIAWAPAHCHARTCDQEERQAALDDETEDVLRNVPAVFTTGTLEAELTGVRRLGAQYARAFLSTVGCTLRLRIGAVSVLSVMLVAFALQAARRLRARTMTAGLFVTIFMIITQWYASLGWLSSNTRDMVIEWGILSAHEQSLRASLLGGASEPTLAAAPPAQAHAPREAPTVDEEANEDRRKRAAGLYVDGVTVRVPGRARPVLDRVTLEVARGERVALVSGVGSGKTTLLKVIAGLVRPAEGRVYVEGRPLAWGRRAAHDGSEADVAATVGYVQQQPTLFNRSVYANITYGAPPNTTRAAVDALVAQLGLADAFHDLPRGLDTRAGKNGSALSGGQRQLVQLMRILLRAPRVVLLDEVTASLDAATKRRVFAVLDTLLAGRTVVMATHDEQLMRTADRTVTFAKRA